MRKDFSLSEGACVAITDRDAERFVELSQKGKAFNIFYGPPPP